MSNTQSTPTKIGVIGAPSLAAAAGLVAASKMIGGVMAGLVPHFAEIAAQVQAAQNEHLRLIRTVSAPTISLIDWVQDDIEWTCYRAGVIPLPKRLRARYVAARYKKLYG